MKARDRLAPIAGALSGRGGMSVRRPAVVILLSGFLVITCVTGATAALPDRSGLAPRKLQMQGAPAPSATRAINDGLPKKWFAGTQGDFDYGYTIETFGAVTFTLDRKLITTRERHYYYRPFGRIQVTVSGTDDQGCTHRAGPKVLYVLPEDAELAFVVPATGGTRAKYDISNQPGTDYFRETKSCPGARPTTVLTEVAWINFPPRPARTTAKIVRGRHRSGPWLFQWCLNRDRAGLTRPYADANNRLRC